MIDVKTSFTPFKMKLSRKEPVVLSLELRNSGTEPEIISFDMQLGQQFSFERAGFKNTVSKKIPEFKPNESKKLYFDIWPKQMVRRGEQPIRLTVTEHYKGFNYVKRKQVKMLKLAVEQ
jgi:hypothetical protein